MFDWKILAASFAALLVVSSVLVGGFGFSDILGKVNEWMGDSPLEGFVTAPSLSSTPASLTFHPEAFALAVESTDFSSGDLELTSFTGKIKANLTSGELTLIQEGGFRATLPLTETTIPKVSLDSLSLESATFSVTSDSLETSGQDVSLEFTGFSGDVTMAPTHITLDGNFTSIVGNGKEII